MIFNSSQGQVFFTLSPADKSAVEGLLRTAGQDTPRQRDDFARRFTDGQHPAWRRYIDGIYNHPKTWWIGIVQTQMVLGIWGARRQAEASIRQTALAQILYQLTAPENRDRSEALIVEAVRFNLQYRKADIAGRFHGGLFTNYASMGGRHGSSATGHGLKWAGRITNLTIASFGAAIGAIAANRETAEDILNAIITGKTEALPARYEALAERVSAEATDELVHIVNGEVHGVDALNRVSPGPVSIREFCDRPENVDLQSICQ